MVKEFLYAGKIVNTHGVRGDVKLHPAAVNVDILAKLKYVYMDQKPWKVVKGSVQKQMVLYHLEGIDDMDAALSIKGKDIYFSRNDTKVDKNVFFDEELYGLRVIDVATKKELGTVSDVLQYPAQRILEVKGEKIYLIPYVDGVFIDGVNLEEGTMMIHYMKGLAVDEN